MNFLIQTLVPLSPSPKLPRSVPTAARTTPQEAGPAPALHAWALREGKVTGMDASAGGFSPWPRPDRYLPSCLLCYFVLLWFITLLLYSHLFCSLAKPANNGFSLARPTASAGKLNVVLLVSVWRREGASQMEFKTIMLNRRGKKGKFSLVQTTEKWEDVTHL